MRQALDTPSDENIQTLAREAGLRIKPKSKTALTVEKLLNSPMLNADTILNGKEDITDAKKKGENYYKKLKQSPIVSPALGAEVLFDQRGWDYITNEGYAKQFDPKKKRSEDEVKQRIALLPKAREVIANATSIEGEPRTEHGSTRFALIGRFSDGEAVRVIVEKREDSDRYFLSVFDLAREAKQLRESPLSTSTLGGAPSVQDKATDASDEKNIAQPQADASVIIDENKLKSGEISVNEFISANGLNPDDYDGVGFDEPTQKTQYQTLISEMLGVADEHIALAEKKIASTPQERKAKANTLGLWRNAIYAIGVIKRNYENPFLTSLAIRTDIPNLLKARFENKFARLSDAEKYNQAELQSDLISAIVGWVEARNPSH